MKKLHDVGHIPESIRDASRHCRSHPQRPVNPHEADLWICLRALCSSIPAAIKLYLSAARRKQTTREITTALKEHGVESTSRNFENTVTTALHRLKIVGDVLKFNDRWALAEFYPENLRRNLAAQAEGKKPTAKAKKRARGKRPAKLPALPPAVDAATG